MSTITHIVSYLKCGKACSNASLSAEHLKYSDRRLFSLLSICFTSMLVHAHLPDEFMKTIIVPLIKDKTGDITNVGNYRPIALTTVFSKVFEHCLLTKCTDKLTTHDNQFGFKSGHSTVACLFALKQTIQYYRSHSSPVFVCCLDASKAVR